MTENNQNIKAIILVLFGMTVFALQDTLIKIISETTSIYLIYFIRCIIGFFVILIYLKYKKKKIIIKTYYPILTILRSFAFFFGFSLYYFSLSKLSLPVAVTLFFVSPFFTSIFSMFIMKEKIGLRRWIAIIVGFVGVFLVMDPDFSNFNIYSAFPVICAFCYSFTIIIQKKTADKDNVFSQIIHIYISAFIFAIIIKVFIHYNTFSPEIMMEYKSLLAEWRIENLNVFLMLIGVGFTGVIGFLCLFSAYNMGSPPSIAPFEYIIIIWALIIGWLLWGDTLNLKGSIGLVLIVSAGIYTFVRESKLNKQISIDKPLR